MTEPIPITIPLINPNEPEARLVAIHVAPGQHVESGDMLCTLETTKSTVDLTAETDGYLVGLIFEVGQTVEAGEILGYLAGSPDLAPPAVPILLNEPQSSRPESLRISQAGLLLAQQHNVDLTQFSSEVFVTEKIIQEMIDLSTKPEPKLQAYQTDSTAIIIYGGGGHGKALIDLIRVLGSYSIAGIVDDGIPVGSSIMGVRVLGGANILGKLVEQGVHLAANAVGGIGNISSRIKVFELLSQAGFTCPTLTHLTAFIEPSAILAEGVQVMPHAYVGSEANVGYGAIVNTGAIVSHDCNLGDYANLSPGAILAGEVTIGNATLVGMGVTVNLRVKIGNHARIGNGATVKQDVPEGGIVRAGTIWPD
ncbi:MAG: NeuD/PglB/VioB family sugar acetyltransferase [Anaerolineales bacterium]|jgi:sugar O-acyltransferase (sialic acid O-acetyltransferase NeuD family)